MIKSLCISLSIATALLCGCASAPLHYYTLTRPLTHTDDNRAAACCKFKITRVLIPPQVDRSELVMRQGDDEALVLSNQLWLSSLRDEIRSALSEGIATKLSDDRNHAHGKTGNYTVLVNVIRFEAVPGEYVLISADSQIQDISTPNGVLCNRLTTVRIAVQSDVVDVIRGYQSALEKIADKIGLALLDQQSTLNPCSPG